MNESTDELLKQLEIERRKFSRSDKMERIVSELVCRQVYPDSGLNGSRKAIEMVENYGVNWHEFSEPHHCIHCKADLRNFTYGTPFKREIYVKHTDRPNEYKCPDCKQIL
jgi:hypothetical protein